MFMDEGDILAVAVKAETALDSYAGALAERVDDINARLISGSYEVRDILSARLASAEAVLVRYVSALTLEAEYHITRAYFHASPGLIAAILAIVAAIKFVAGIIAQVLNIWKIAQAIHLDDLLYRIFPKFEQFINEIMTKVSEFSAYLGWGVDGVNHLLSAVHGGVNVWCGLSGKDYGALKMGWFDRTMATMNHFQDNIALWRQDPGRWLNQFVESSEAANFLRIGRWWGDQSSWIREGVDRAEKALTGLGRVTGELASIQTGMPQAVAKYIPSSIWEGLNRADSVINDDILPKISAIGLTVDRLDKLLGSYSEKTKELARRLAFPGDLLEGVDELHEVLREMQEAKVDDVASRQWGRDVDADIEAMTGDLEAFAKIDAALKAPTPEPVFMSIESPARREITGIVEEPRETWMVGGYDSPY